MIQVSQIKLPIAHEEVDLKNAIEKIYKRRIFV